MPSVAQRPPRGPHHFVANGTITYEVFPEELVEVIQTGQPFERRRDKKADRQGRNALDIARAAGYYDLEARLRLLSET